MQKLTGLIRRAVTDYNMIEKGDHIAVAVSGGKDSLALLIGLAQLKKYSDTPFWLTAITLDPCFNNKPNDYSSVEKLCRQLDIPYIIKRTELYHIIFETRKEKNPCSLCARMRRGILHDMAKAAKCNKIALGHHIDDAVETFFLNLFYGARISCFSPVSYLSRKDLYLIRPLIYHTEAQINAAAQRLNLPIVKSRCPMEKDTQRLQIKQLIAKLEKDFSSLRKKVFLAMQQGNISGFGINKKS